MKLGLSQNLKNITNTVIAAYMLSNPAQTYLADLQQKANLNNGEDQQGAFELVEGRSGFPGKVSKKVKEALARAEVPVSGSKIYKSSERLELKIPPKKQPERSQKPAKKPVVHPTHTSSGDDGDPSIVDIDHTAFTREMLHEASELRPGIAKKVKENPLDVDAIIAKAKEKES